MFMRKTSGSYKGSGTYQGGYFYALFPSF